MQNWNQELSIPCLMREHLEKKICTLRHYTEVRKENQNMEQLLVIQAHGSGSGHLGAARTIESHALDITLI